MLEPLERYRLRYDDPGVCSFDLEWAAIMDPWAPPKGDPPRVTHLDQWGHVTGELVLHGETIAVDCYAMRDRSWQITRPEGGTTPFWGGEINNGWMAAAADASTAFFGTKWIVLDGHLSPVVESEVRRERDRNHGWLRRIIITARDEDGRDFEAVGESVSRLIAPVPNTHVVSVNSLMDYRINGIQAWGDDQDSWATRHLGGDAAQADGTDRRPRNAAEQRAGGRMKFDKGRDLARTGDVLEEWLRQRLDLVTATVSDLTLPDRAGLSNETILFRAELDDGAQHDDRGARPPGQSVTVLPTAAWTRSSTPRRGCCRSCTTNSISRVPNVRWFEADPRWFDRPFFVMDHATVGCRSASRSTTPRDGSTTPRRRSGGRRGSRRSTELDPHQPACHPTSSASFPGADRGSPRCSTRIRAEYAWACDGVEHPIVDRLWEWLESNVPTTPPTGLSWGDARVGNIMFDDDFQVVVVMDWELVSLGTPIMDLGWWLFFDDVHRDEYPRLDGLGDRQETIERWEQGTGSSADGRRVVRDPRRGAPRDVGHPVEEPPRGRGGRLGRVRTLSRTTGSAGADHRRPDVERQGHRTAGRQGGADRPSSASSHRL